MQGFRDEVSGSAAAGGGPSPTALGSERPSAPRLRRGAPGSRRARAPLTPQPGRRGSCCGGSSGGAFLPPPGSASGLLPAGPGPAPLHRVPRSGRRGPVSCLDPEAALTAPQQHVTPPHVSRPLRAGEGGPGERGRRRRPRVAMATGRGTCPCPRPRGGAPSAPRRGEPPQQGEVGASGAEPGRPRGSCLPLGALARPSAGSPASVDPDQLTPRLCLRFPREEHSWTGDAVD
ncbi:translation initiation factor IF-2-like [Canis lupus dingo]|uniref:translation initiation factor IF-2-like n=1 Tax=Canis lupus dingo TaxID=286419 RepID=UPI0020C24CCD|nr:translation initiation factor IF-2-like [Canis lupus dingo]